MYLVSRTWMLMYQYFFETLECKKFIKSNGNCYNNCIYDKLYLHLMIENLNSILYSLNYSSILISYY